MIVWSEDRPTTFLSSADGIVDLAGDVTIGVSSPADLAGDLTVGVSSPADLAGVVTVGVSFHGRPC